MAENTIMSEKHKALLAHKDKLLQDIKYYESRIDATRLCRTIMFDNDESSDSDSDLLPQFDPGPSIAELRQQQMMLKTCLEATQELSGLQILEHGVNMVVDSPHDGPKLEEFGTWHEVIVECRLDLIHFSLSFYVHKPYDKFAQLTFHGLQVSLAKKPHEIELMASVLPSLTRPSDVVEVIRNYAAEYRSRRTTLARLADKFNELLHMEPLPQGGYVVRCANVLELQWSLQNKWSPIAPFHHRMKFDLDYMEESYVESIREAHRQLSEPQVDTEERTGLLAAIISVCLQARGPAQEVYESMSSDPETAQKLKERRTTLDREPEVPPLKRIRGSDVMAPPRSLPKKMKKGKESLKKNKDTEGKDADVGVEKDQNIDKGGGKDVRKSIPEKNTKKKDAAEKDNTDRDVGQGLNKDARVQKEKKIEKGREKDVKKSVPEKSVKQKETVEEDNTNRDQDKVLKGKDSNIKRLTSAKHKESAKDSTFVKEKDAGKKITDDQPRVKKDTKKRQIEETSNNAVKKMKTVKDNGELSEDKADKRKGVGKPKEIQETENIASLKNHEGPNVEKVLKSKLVKNGDGKANTKNVQKSSVKEKVLSSKKSNDRLQSVNTELENKQEEQKNINDKAKNDDNKNEQNAKVKSSEKISDKQNVRKDKANSIPSSKNKAKSTDNDNVAGKKIVSPKNLKAKSDSNINKHKDTADANKVYKKVMSADGKVVKKIQKVASDTNLNNKVDNVKKVTNNTEVPRNFQNVKTNENIKNLADLKNAKPTNSQSNNEKTKTSGKDSTSKQPANLPKAPLKSLNKPKVGNTKPETEKREDSTKLTGSKEKENSEIANQKLIKSKLPLTKVISKMPTRVSPRKSISTLSTKIKPVSQKVASKLKPGSKPATNIPRLVPKR